MSVCLNVTHICDIHSSDLSQASSWFHGTAFHFTDQVLSAVQEAPRGLRGLSVARHPPRNIGPSISHTAPSAVPSSLSVRLGPGPRICPVVPELRVFPVHRCRDGEQRSWCFTKLEVVQMRGGILLLILSPKIKGPSNGRNWALRKGVKYCLSPLWKPSITGGSRVQEPGDWLEGPDVSTVRATWKSKRTRCVFTFYLHETFPGNRACLIVTPGPGTEVPTGRGSVNIWEMVNKLFY